MKGLDGGGGGGGVSVVGGGGWRCRGGGHLAPAPFPAPTSVWKGSCWPSYWNPIKEAF